MKIAVCDDEREIRNAIERAVRLLYPEAEILTFGDAEALLSCTERMDVLFLDIQMDGMNGMEAAKALRKAGNDVTIIFVTALEEYVFQAFDVQAFHYLVKPIDRSRLFEVLRRAVQERAERDAAAKTEPPSLVVKKGTVTQKIFLHDIIYLEVFNRTITLHTTDGDIAFYGKMSELEQSLAGDFVRCHRAFLVNFQYVKKYDAGSITLDNGKTILLAKKKYAYFVREYMRWLQEVGNA